MVVFEVQVRRFVCKELCRPLFLAKRRQSVFKRSSGLSKSFVVDLWLGACEIPHRREEQGDLLFVMLDPCGKKVVFSHKDRSSRGDSRRPFKKLVSEDQSNRFHWRFYVGLAVKRGSTTERIGIKILILPFIEQPGFLECNLFLRRVFCLFDTGEKHLVLPKSLIHPVNR